MSPTFLSGRSRAYSPTNSSHCFCCCLTKMSSTLFNRKYLFLEFLGLVLFAGIILILVLVANPQTDTNDVVLSALPAVKDDGKGELLSLHIVYRHGDRTPVILYKNDPYVNYSWPEGFGQLTNRGKERIYRYGQILHQRYIDYIVQVDRQNVLAQSSPVRRCLESSEVLLASLYPPRSDQFWSRVIPLARQWQPIAIQTTELARAWLLNPTTPCLSAKQIESIASQLPSMKSFLDENANFIAQLKQATGVNFTRIEFALHLYDILLTEKFYFGDQFQPPNWLTKLGNNTWEKLANFARVGFAKFQDSPKYLRLRAGAFLHQLVSNLNATVASLSSNETFNRQLFTYGTHDLMIAYILQALGLYSDLPSFGSGFILELRRNSAKSPPYVRLLYSNVTNNFELHELPLNESSIFELCDSKYCTVEAFGIALDDYLVEDIEKECATLSREVES